MTARESDPLSKFDFNFRPDYWNPADPQAVIIENATGEMRRPRLEMVPEGDALVAAFVNEGGRESHLPPDHLLAGAFVHPWALGGEFLPECLPGELEIARILLQSSTMDVVSVRAHRKEGRIHYRIVTEYPECEEEYLAYVPMDSSEPLSFGELIAFIDSFEDPQTPRPNSFIEALRETCYEEWGMDLPEAADFVRVSSPFYPQLEEFYSDLRVEEWYEKKRRERLEPCPDCGQIYDPVETHGCPEERARLRREAEQAKEFEARVAPFQEAIEQAYEDWRCVDPGGPGAGGLVGQCARARASALRRFLRDWVARRGEMPVGTHMIEYRFMSPDVRTFTVDLDTLREKATEARTHFELARKVRAEEEAERETAVRKALVGAPEIVLALHVIRDWFEPSRDHPEDQAPGIGGSRPCSPEQKIHCLELFLLSRFLEGKQLPIGIHMIEWPAGEDQPARFRVDFGVLSKEIRRRVEQGREMS